MYSHVALPILRWPGEACYLWRWPSPGALVLKLGEQGAVSGACSGAQLRSQLQRFQVSCSSAQFSCALLLPAAARDSAVACAHDDPAGV